MPNQTLQERPVVAPRAAQIIPQIDTEPLKPSKAKEALHITSMSVPIIGLLGTLFVWCAANFYTGEVEIVTDRPAPDLLVNVYSQRGQSFTFHVNKFQLMPGEYRVEVSADGKTKLPADIKVSFHGLNRILVPFGSKSVSVVNMAPNSVQGSADVASAASETSVNESGIDAPSLTDSQTRPSEQEDLPPVIPATQSPTNAATEAKVDSTDENLIDSTTDAKSTRRWWQFWRKDSQ